MCLGASGGLAARRLVAVEAVGYFARACDAGAALATVLVGDVGRDGVEPPGVDVGRGRDDRLGEPDALLVLGVDGAAQSDVFVFSEWLLHAMDRRLLTDDETALGMANVAHFHENRHDQTLMSLLSKKYGIPAFTDVSQYGYADARKYGNHALNWDALDHQAHARKAVMTVSGLMCDTFSNTSQKTANFPHGAIASSDVDQTTHKLFDSEHMHRPSVAEVI